MKGKMKKIIAGIATLTMAAQFAFVVPVSAALTEKANYTFDEATPVNPFTGDSRISAEIVTAEKVADGPTTTEPAHTQDPWYSYPLADNNALGFRCANNAQNGYSFAHYDFSSLVTGSGETKIEFDYYNRDDGRAIVSLGDGSVRGNTGGSSNTTYNSKGVIFNLGSNRDNAILNNDNSLAKTTYCNKWLHVAVDVNELTKKYSYTITPQAGGDAIAKGTDVSFLANDAVNLSQIDLFGYINNSPCAMIDNLVISADIKQSYKVTYSYHSKTGDYEYGEVSSDETVIEGQKPVKVPTEADVRRAGYIFKGWSTDGSDIYDAAKESTYKSMDGVANTAIAAATTYTAVYQEDSNYIEPIVKAEITGPDTMTFGPNTNTAADNEFTLTLTGELGTIITSETMDNRATNFKVEWDIEGFKTENDTEGQYCDSYGAIVDVTDTENKTTPIGTRATDINFALKEVPMNFYGRMKATVTYSWEEGAEGASSGTALVTTATKYVAALGSTNQDSNIILPRAGYPSDFDNYSDSLIGYETAKTTFDDVDDIIVGSWRMSGSDGSKSAVITTDEEDTNKYLKISAPTAKKSHALSTNLKNIVTQAIFEQDMRFHNGGAQIFISEGYPIWQEKNYKNPITLAFDGTNITLNGSKLQKDEADVTFAMDKWYRVLLSVDSTSRLCYAKVYDGQTLVAESPVVKWNDGDMQYYSVGFGSGNDTGTVDFDNYSAYYATPDMSKFIIDNQGKTTLSTKIADDSIGLTASMVTADDHEMTGAATWSVLESDMESSIDFEIDEDDSHKAKITLTDDAVPGTATVQVNIGGYIAAVEVEITTSGASVKFTKSSSSISIPLDTSKREEAEYEAIVVDENGEKLNDTTLAIYDKNNRNPFELPAGITFKDGKLTVTSDAKATTFTIRATGQDDDSNTLTRGIKVSVHGLAFDFGGDGENDVAEGYTAVSLNTPYTEARGYGIVGAPTAGGTGSTTSADADYMDGQFTFKADVQKNKIYTVEVTFMGSIKAEPVEGNSDLTAYTVGNQIEMTKATYSIPVLDDSIEITMADYTYVVDDKGTKDTSDDEKATVNPRIASITITKQADKAPGEKQSIYHVGDSTSANSGSWAYHIDHNRNSFPTLNELATFYNSGAGGRNLSTYYTEGKLASVLNAIKPGDIVMFGNNGTNGMGKNFETDVNYYLDAFETFGANIIINSYTPHGAVSNYAGGYDASTYTFTSYRTDSYDEIVRKVAEEREASDPNYLGFVEIGKKADASFTAYVQDGADAAEKAARATEIISCFSDHNHYSAGSKARELMLNGYDATNGTHYEGIIEQIVEILNNKYELTAVTKSALKDGTETGDKAITFTATSNSGNGSKTLTLFVAQYDASGNLVDVTVQDGQFSRVNSAIDVEFTPVADATVKAFAWDGMTPLLTNTAVSAPAPSGD